MLRAHQKDQRGPESALRQRARRALQEERSKPSSLVPVDVSCLTANTVYAVLQARGQPTNGDEGMMRAKLARLLAKDENQQTARVQTVERELMGLKLRLMQVAPTPLTLTLTLSRFEWSES